MNWITEHLPAWNSWIALMMYWLPAALCAYGYTVKSVKEYKRDRTDRARDEAWQPDPAKQHQLRPTYIPGITIGTLVGYAALTVCPVANLFAAIFDVAPKVFSGFIRWCDKVLNVPLVPKRGK